MRYCLLTSFTLTIASVTKQNRYPANFSPAEEAKYNRNSRYFPATMRVAVNVPIMARKPIGFSSSSVLPTKITLPDSELSEANLPLKICVPVSLQHVPIGNSTSPEKPTRSFVVCSHAAGRGDVSGLESAAVSSSKKVPAPFACASRIRFISVRPANVNFTRQRPVRSFSSGFCAAKLEMESSKHDTARRNLNRESIQICIRGGWFHRMDKIETDLHVNPEESCKSCNKNKAAGRADQPPRRFKPHSRV